MSIDESKRILILFEIIPGAVRRQETDDRIENVIKDWLKYASDRDISTGGGLGINRQIVFQCFLLTVQ
jgi:hypothetical protein